MQPIPKVRKSQIGLNEVLAISQEAIMSRLNCHNVGRILSFNPETQTADIQMMQLKQFNERILTPAVLSDVPLLVYGISNAHITLPDPTGSYCLLFFIDRDIDAFLETGEMYLPISDRKHDFSDCVALTTFNPFVKPISNYDADSISIEYKNSSIKVKNVIVLDAKDEVYLKSPTKVILDTPNVETTGNLNVATGYTGVIPCGSTSIQVTNGIITGVV